MDIPSIEADTLNGIILSNLYHGHLHTIYTAALTLITVCIPSSLYRGITCTNLTRPAILATSPTAFLDRHGRIMMGWTIESAMSPEWRKFTDELVSDDWFESLSEFISDEVKECFGQHTPPTIDQLRLPPASSLLISTPVALSAPSKSDCGSTICSTLSTISPGKSTTSFVIQLLRPLRISRSVSLPLPPFQSMEDSTKMLSLTAASFAALPRRSSLSGSWLLSLEVGALDGELSIWMC